MLREFPATPPHGWAHFALGRPCGEMNTLEAIRQRLAVLEPLRVDLVDESHLHAGHAGARDGGGHYRLTVVSPRFSGRPTMERHRLVYDAIGELMKRDIHALSIIAKAPDEAP